MTDQTKAMDAKSALGASKRLSSTLLLVPLCAGLVLAAAMFQHRMVLGIAPPLRGYVVPILVGGSFGYMLMRILRLRQKVATLNDKLSTLLTRKTQALDRSQAQLLQAQKMSSLGQLAASVAHDFNNVLNCIMSGATLAQTLSEDADSKELLDSVIHSTESGAMLTKQILSFGRPADGVIRSVRLDDAIEKAMTMLRLTITGSIDLNWQGNCEEAKITVSTGHLEQLLMNLVVNSRDAIDGEGSIEISSRQVEIENSPHLCIQVADSGCGMSEELQSKVLQTFFTTKDEGKGTGLGLSVVKNIVESNQGSLKIASKVGAGTTMSVSFPVAPKDVA